MSDRDKIYAIIWGCVTVMMLALIGSELSSIIKTKDTLARMVEAGHTPIEASCAVYDTSGDSPTCVLIAKRGE